MRSEDQDSLDGVNQDLLVIVALNYLSSLAFPSNASETIWNIETAVS